MMNVCLGNFRSVAGARGSEGRKEGGKEGRQGTSPFLLRFAKASGRGAEEGGWKGGGIDEEDEEEEEGQGGKEGRGGEEMVTEKEKNGGKEEEGATKEEGREEKQGPKRPRPGSVLVECDECGGLVQEEEEEVHRRGHAAEEKRSERQGGGRERNVSMTDERGLVERGVGMAWKLYCSLPKPTRREILTEAREMHAEREGGKEEGGRGGGEEGGGVIDSIM
jgi:hypothetical protein